MIIGRLRTLQKELNLDDNTIINALRTTEERYNDFITNRAELSIGNLIHVAQTFNISIDWLIHGKGSMLLLNEDLFKTTQTQQNENHFNILYGDNYGEITINSKGIITKDKNK